ncbi:hypothetical protein GH714_011592 [Hevea brasiliensis]|uniref:NB-ARC domain-containing protein n=1 Tax=Hevea brasiliensis TaxID=3981 RepID=A0A6A6N0I7_HEVBR|nr:hypothetical protein GH714_011592 [Hevea brasiliensis]
MVEAIVSFAIERIADAVVREASSFYGVRDEVEQLQTELKRIQCFLKDADSKQDQDERVRNCIAEIRDIAYEAEDVIDTFLLKAATGSRKGIWRLIKRATFMVIKVPYLHEIGTQIKSIQAKMGSVSTSMLTYGIKFTAGEGSRSTSEMQQRLRRSFPHDEEDDVISLEASLRDVQSQLMMEEEQRRVVSIVGMGGLGKTTLAKTIYNDSHVKQHFDCHSWSFISQQFSTRDVLEGILIEVASKQDKFDLVKMEEEKFLQLRLKRIEEEVDMIVEEQFSKWMLKQKKRTKEDQWMKEDQLSTEEEKLLQMRLERVENEVDRMVEQQLSKMKLKQNKRMKEDRQPTKEERFLQLRLERVENEVDRMVEQQWSKLMLKRNKGMKEDEPSTEEEKLLQLRLDTVENEVDEMVEEQLSELMMKKRKRMNEEELSKFEFVKMEEEKLPQLRLEGIENKVDRMEEEQSFNLELKQEKWMEEVQSFKLELKQEKWREEVQSFKLELKQKKWMDEVQLFKLEKRMDEVQFFKMEKRMKEVQLFKSELKKREG